MKRLNQSGLFLNDSHTIHHLFLAESKGIPLSAFSLTNIVRVGRHQKEHPVQIRIEPISLKKVYFKSKKVGSNWSSVKLKLQLTKNFRSLADATRRFILSDGSSRRGEAEEHLSKRTIGHLPMMASGEEIMTIIFISSTCCFSPPCCAFQDDPSAWSQSTRVSSISFSVGGGKHKSGHKMEAATISRT